MPLTLFTEDSHTGNTLILGPDETAILPVSVFLKVMHAHMRGEVTTDFRILVHFDSLAKFKGYMN